MPLHDTKVPVRPDVVVHLDGALIVTCLPAGYWPPLGAHPEPMAY